MKGEKTKSQAAGDDNLVAGVTAVVDAALGVGASIAKVLAQAAAPGRPVTPPDGSGALNAIIHYSIAAATNIAGLVIGSVGGLRMTRGPTTGPMRTKATPGPRVHAGVTLRIPLSIENTGDSPMKDVAFRCQSLDYFGHGEGSPLDARSVRFNPAVLNILPRDFEKLTVFIDTAPESALGRYRATIEMGSSGGVTVIEFDVASPRAVSAAP